MTLVSLYSQNQSTNFDGSEHDEDRATAIAVSRDGMVHVTGTSPLELSNHDYVTISYTPKGGRLWVWRYYGLWRGDDVSSAIAVDGRGNVIVTGTSAGVGDGGDYATIKYNTLGDLNCDVSVDFVDVVLLGNILSGLLDLTGTCGEVKADIDEDGDIDEDDYNLLYDMVAGAGP